MSLGRISETSPYEDALLHIRQLASMQAPPHIRVKEIRKLIAELDEVMERLRRKGVVPPGKVVEILDGER